MAAQPRATKSGDEIRRALDELLAAVIALSSVDTAKFPVVLVELDEARDDIARAERDPAGAAALQNAISHIRKAQATLVPIRKSNPVVGVLTEELQDVRLRLELEDLS